MHTAPPVTSPACTNLPPRTELRWRSWRGKETRNEQRRRRKRGAARGREGRRTGANEGQRGERRRRGVRETDRVQGMKGNEEEGRVKREGAGEKVNL